MTSTPSTLELTAAAIFAIAILHTFLVKVFQGIASRFPEGSVGENLFHLLGEVEVVFGFWAAILLAFLALHAGPEEARVYLEGRDFTEPAFVFAIMTICSTRPVLSVAENLIELCSRALPLPRSQAFYISVLILGPLLGSFITEPAAMTVTALLLLDRYYSRGISDRLKYATLGLLFVNVSIGGTLTPYAAPPILMVAPKWGWDLQHMLANFGWKGALACVVSTAAVAILFSRELGSIPQGKGPAEKPRMRIPLWVKGLHLLFLSAVVMSSHHLVVFVGIFLFFLGLAKVTEEYQTELKIREALLVGFFLGGLVVLGGPQRFWLEPILAKLEALPLFLSATALTAVTDNAALTYLGSLVPDLGEASRYALVAGAVTGGGLTVIANAPNPAGYGILNGSFGKEGISPLRLFLWALGPTLVAAACFWVL